MTTTILHFILAIFTAIASVITYSLWHKGNFQDINKKRFFIFFVFFTAYHLCLSLPYLFLQKNLTAMSWGYISAIVFLFLFCLPMWKLILGLANVSTKATKFIIGIFLLIGLLGFFIKIYDFQLPIIHSSGLIIWNADLISAWLTFICVGTLPFSFFVFFFKNYPKNLGFDEKLKTIFFGGGGLTYSLACVYFIAWNVDMVISAFILVTLGTILFIMPFLMPKRKQIEIQ